MSVYFKKYIKYKNKYNNIGGGYPIWEEPHNILPRHNKYLEVQPHIEIDLQDKLKNLLELLNKSLQSLKLLLKELLESTAESENITEIIDLLNDVILNINMQTILMKSLLQNINMLQTILMESTVSNIKYFIDTITGYYGNNIINLNKLLKLSLIDTFNIEYNMNIQDELNELLNLILKRLIKLERLIILKRLIPPLPRLSDTTIRPQLSRQSSSQSSSQLSIHPTDTISPPMLDVELNSEQIPTEQILNQLIVRQPVIPRTNTAIPIPPQTLRPITTRPIPQQIPRTNTAIPIPPQTPRPITTRPIPIQPRTAREIAIQQLRSELYGPENLPRVVWT